MHAERRRGPFRIDAEFEWHDMRHCQIAKAAKTQRHRRFDHFGNLAAAHIDRRYASGVGYGCRASPLAPFAERRNSLRVGGMDIHRSFAQVAVHTWNE